MKYHKRTKKPEPKPEENVPLEMDPIGANNEYNTIKGMYKTDDLVTPKDIN